MHSLVCDFTDVEYEQVLALMDEIIEDSDKHGLATSVDSCVQSGGHRHPQFLALVRETTLVVAL